MTRIFGFDIGTTSIGFAVIDHNVERETGEILRLGVRIFPEARDPDGTPLNQQRRQKRMMRRQLRRRRMRRRSLNEQLTAAGLLPPYGSAEWRGLMNRGLNAGGAEDASDPYELRRRGLSEPLTPWQFGRAIYHLAQHRHFKGRDLVETEAEEDSADEKEAAEGREATLQALKRSGQTLGEHLAARPAGERRRGVHANRDVVSSEFSRLWEAQAAHHPRLRDPEFRAGVEETIFAQRPVFWRKNTLGQCRFMPGEALCPRGSWLSQQRRMLEKLNNLEIAGGNLRKLDEEEREAILVKLQVQASMSWSGVRSALKPLFKARGEPGGEARLKFNLELGGEPKLMGNAVEAKLADIFGAVWEHHPHKQAIRDAVHERLWAADYGEIGTQRVVILPEPQRRRLRRQAEVSFIKDFGVTPEQAARLKDLKLPTGWEPFSTKALERFLPSLEAGVRFGALRVGPDRDRPTGEVLDRLPSPRDSEEQKRLAALRNPTVIRTQNELRKVVNNLIGLYGKPDLIRIELAREVGKSKREREEMKAGIRANEKRRKIAAEDLRSKGIEPSSRDIEKWLLWKEGQERCPYTRSQISFDALFRNNEFEVEHIWPRSRSLDDSFGNKTLCRRDVNLIKGNRTPYEAFAHRPDEWRDIQDWLQKTTDRNGVTGLRPGKVKRFLATELPADFASRQLNDTGFAARQAVAFLKRLWPDVGIEAPMTVQAVSGRVTAQLRRAWGLNNILSDDGEKTRADHRHHAIDALVVACTSPAMTKRLSDYFKRRDDPGAQRPELAKPWPGVRQDADKAVSEVVVSHRVRRKVSGPLHMETTYGDTGEDEVQGKIAYRQFVTRKKVESLTKTEIEKIRDPVIREIVGRWVAEHGGDPKKAFATYPRLGANGPEIRKVRLLTKQQLGLMAKVSTGYADTGSNHHIAIYRRPDGSADFEIVSLFEAAGRLARREPIVTRRREGGTFVMSLAPGEVFKFRDDAGGRGYRVVQGVWASGVIVTQALNDADGSSVWRPSAGTLVKAEAVKYAIDPIGRVRPAND